MFLLIPCQVEVATMRQHPGDTSVRACAAARRWRDSLCRVALVGAIAGILVALAVPRAAAQYHRYQDWAKDPNFIAAQGNASAGFPGTAGGAGEPVWWLNGGAGRLIFKMDHSVGFYLGFNAQGSWIRHESGKVYVYNRQHGTLTVGAASIDQVPPDVGQTLPVPDHRDMLLRYDGMITRNSDGTATLTYDLLMPGKPPQKMTFTGLVSTNVKPGDWAWIGDPAQADPGEVQHHIDSVANHTDSWNLQLSAPGETPGSAGIVTVDSMGVVSWQFTSRAMTAPFFAHGEHGKLTRQADGSARLSFTLVEPGRADRPMSLWVQRPRLIMNPVLEFGLLTGNCGAGYYLATANRSQQGITVPPLLDTNDAWIWADVSNHDPDAIGFNLLPDGWVRWSVMPLGAARALLAGPTLAEAVSDHAANAKPEPRQTAQTGPVEDPNLPREGAMKPIVKALAPVVWSYQDSTIPAVWPTRTQFFQDTFGRELTNEVEYLGFNAKGTWLESCDGTHIAIWNGKAQTLAEVAQNMASVPADLSNPSDFLVRYEAAVQVGDVGAAVSANRTPDPLDPLQAVGLIPGEMGATAFSAPVGTRSGGTGAKFANGVLTYKDSESGATVSLHVQRPAFVTAQPMMMKSLGSSGMWIWLSDDRQQARIVNVGPDGSVNATVVPAQSAIGMISAGSPH